MKSMFLLLLLFTFIVLMTWLLYSAPMQTRSKLSVYKQSLFSNYFYIHKYNILPKSAICSAVRQPFLIIIVTSYVGHVELRSAHRRAMPEDYLNRHNVARIFLLAHIPSNDKYIKQEAIQNESNTFGDILQGTFIENYRNLTYKHLMGLKWAADQCNKAVYILKVDDDTVFNFYGTIKMLQHIKSINRSNFLMGYMLNNTVPRRNSQNKWFVTWKEYEYSFYPSYVSGWYYVTTPEVAKKIAEAAIYHKNFWIDDILVTGIITESLGIPLKHVPDNVWLEYYEQLECCIRDMVEKNIECSYIVGPNGSRNNLIFEFNEALNKCKRLINCTANSNKSESLKINCVAYKDRAIFGRGQPKIDVIKL